jgi:hypothetical protein
MGEDTRRNIRIAAAVENMSEGEWCIQVLDRAAEVAIPEEVKAAMKAKAKKKAREAR